MSWGITVQVDLPRVSSDSLHSRLEDSNILIEALKRDIIANVAMSHRTYIQDGVACHTEEEAVRNATEWLEELIEESYRNTLLHIISEDKNVIKDEW